MSIKRKWLPPPEEPNKLRAHIVREFSASRMSSTKWAELADVLSDFNTRLRVKFVDVAAVRDVARIRHVSGDWLDTFEFGPFLANSIEWLEIEAGDQAEAIEKRLKALRIPFEREDQLLRIIGHVRASQ